jgi:hypothetical protein
MPPTLPVKKPPQDEFPFGSLDFPGRTTLHPCEIAERWGCSVEQVYNLVDLGALPALTISGPKSSRRHVRIPIESYRNATLSRMTDQFIHSPISQLPTATLIELHRDLTTHLTKLGKL